MSDTQYTVELVAELTSVKLGSATLQKLQADAKAAGKALDFSAQAKASVNALAAIKLDPKGFVAAHAATKALAAEQRKLIRGHDGFLGGLKSAVTSPFASTTSAVALGELAGRGIISAAGLLVDAAVKVASIIKDGVALAFESAGHQEHLQTSFKYLFGGQAGGQAVLDQADRYSKSLPFGSLKTAGYLGGLGRAGITGQSAANSLSLAADAGALSPDGQGTDEALYALERLKRHGEFSPRLAEGLNVNLTDFYTALGKKLNISAAAAQKKLSTPGAIGFNTIQNTLLDVHRTAIGGGLAGAPALDQSRELLQRWERIKELPEEYLRNIANAPGWSRLSDTLGEVLDRLDPNKHPEIVRGLIDAFGHLAQQAKDLLTPENIDRFTRSLEQLPAQLARVADGLGATVKLLGTAADLIGLLPGASPNAPPEGSGSPQGPSKWSEAATIGAAAARAAWAVTKPGLLALYPESLFGSDDSDKPQAAGKPASWWDRDLFGSDNKQTATPGIPSAQQRGPVTIAPVIQVTVQAAPGSTAEDHGRQVAEAAGKHLSNELERAAQQSGAL